ncbi:N-acetylmuramoyl-L-alanine amidase [Bacillus sp. T33-2]|nr:N-acetylmuramoyl-L-alanine amidase [Bacillus sp. T33-2]
MIAVLLTITLAAGSFADQHPAIAESKSVTIGTNKLNVREGPGLSYSVTARVNKGEKYLVVKQTGDWIQIKLTGAKKGWVAEWFVTVDEKNKPAEGTEPSGKTRQGTVTADSVNIRDGASMNAKVIGKMNRGESITILSQSNSWTQISFSRQKAWINSQFVSVSSDNQPKNAGSTVGTVTASTLSVRNQGSLNAKLVGSVSQGEQFKILEETNNWVKIEYKPGSYGWAAGWFFEKTSQKKPVPSADALKNSRVKILFNGTNIRKGPGTENAVVQRASQGDSFEVVGLNNDWYQIRLKNGSDAYIAGWLVSVAGAGPQIEKPGAEVHARNKLIIIDPGHGGRDNGTTGARGTLEKELTLRTAKLVYAKLKSSGANVVLTRSHDTYMSLSARRSMANSLDADVFISLHYDSINDRSVRGMTSYYYHGYQKALSEQIHSSVIKRTKLKNRGVRQGDFHVVRENSSKAVLLELGYLSSPTEEMLVKSSQYQEAVAAGIYEGLARHFKEN